MNIVLVVVDSLRAASLGGGPGAPCTPFLERLNGETFAFRRAHASECWTLPTHLSMFTGLLPSEHGGHFQHLGYAQRTPTIAERLRAAGYATEILTRNSMFDGTLPGVTRGFQHNHRVLAPRARAASPLGLLVALAKPRIRRLIRDSGFVAALQRDNRAFITTLARMIVPADEQALGLALERMATHRRSGTPYFLFLNLYDVHAPYPPTRHSPLRPFTSPEAWIENLMLPRLATQLGAHAYLRRGFRFSPRARQVLRTRYHRAIELMDAKLARFHAAARSAGLLDDTLLVITADHGEAFDDHDLYFHDASVYQTHLHVPLWIHHPERAPQSIDDVVSTRDLYALFAAVGERRGLAGTLLDAAARRAAPLALAEHFRYPHVADCEPRFAQNLAAAVVGDWKVIARREGTALYDLARDPDEQRPDWADVGEFAVRCRRAGAPRAAIDAARAHLERWQALPVAA